MTTSTTTAKLGKWAPILVKFQRECGKFPRLRSDASVTQKGEKNIEIRYFTTVTQFDNKFASFGDGRLADSDPVWGRGGF